MAIGKRRKARQREMFVATSKSRARGASFYRALDNLLEEDGFDEFADSFYVIIGKSKRNLRVAS